MRSILLLAFFACSITTLKSQIIAQALPGCLNIDSQVGVTCGGGSSFFGINGSGQFEFNNVDGEFCCGSGGDFNSYFDFETIDISCFTDVELSIDYSAALTNGQSSFEDDSPSMPLSGCGPNSNSHDQIYITVTVNGPAPITFTHYVHGTTVADFTGTFTVAPFTVPGMTTMDIRVSASNKAQGEHFYIENLLVEGVTSADAGPDLVTCGTNPVNLMATGTGTWSGGIGTYSNINDPQSTYTPDVSESPGPITLTWTCGPASSNCPVTGSDDMEISFGTTAMATMTSPTTVLCVGGCIEVFFSVSGGAGGPYDLTFNITVPGFPIFPITITIPSSTGTTNVCTTTSVFPSYDPGTNTAYIPEFISTWTIQLVAMEENGCPGMVDGTPITFNIVQPPVANSGCLLMECTPSGVPVNFDLTAAENCVNSDPANTISWYSDAGATIMISSPYSTAVTTSVYAVVEGADCDSDPVAVALIVQSITTIGLANVICNDNGTPSDPSDDFITFTLDPDGGVAGTMYNVTVSSGTVNPTTGMYGGPTSFQMQLGSAGGGDIMITVTDVLDPGCSLTETLIDPESCSDQCLLQMDGLANVICDDGGTPADASDDIIFFDLNPTGLNLGPTYSVFVSSGTVFPGSSGYGSSTTFSMQPGSAGGGNVIITIADNNDPSCTLTVTLVDPGSCSGQCDIQNEGITNVTCVAGPAGDGTDDVISFELDPTGVNLSATYDVLVSMGSVLPTSGVYGSANSFELQPGSAGNGDVIITLIDSNDPSCTWTFTLTDPGSCSTPLCNITDEGIFQQLCGDNGTPSDPTDDWWTFGLDPIGSNLGTTYTISVDVGSVTPSFGTYGQGTIFQLQNGSASGGDVVVTIIDDTDGTCFFIFVVMPTGPCSGSCMIDNGGFANLACDGNGTADMTDDIISFDLNPSGVSLMGGYTVSVNNGTITPGAGNYGEITSFTLNQGSAGGGNVLVTITDNTDPSCQFVVLVIDPGPCSGACSMDYMISPTSCNDNGTPSDPSDDTFSFDITFTGMNLGSGWTADDPLNSSGDYDITYTLGPYDIANGNIMFNVVDNDNPSCDLNFTVAAPNPCSDGCSIDDVMVVNTICDNNMTPIDDADDIYYFELIVSGSNVGPGWIANDPLSSNGTYDTNVLMGPYDISAGAITFMIIDSNDPTCTFEVTVNPPNPCSTQCSLNAVVSNIVCDDNGTESDPSDDQFTYVINVGGSNLGSGWSANDALSTVGNYNVDVVFGPYFIGQGGTLSIDITDDDDINCVTTVDVLIPDPCSGMCTIGASTNNYQCFNNGTASDTSDDFYTFDLIVNGTNTGPGWVANDPNNSSGSYGIATNVGPYLLNAGNLNFDITDVNDDNCEAFAIIQPPFCVFPCEIEDIGLSNVQCNNNGTPDDPDDDFITFDLNPIGGTLATTGYMFNTTFPVTPMNGLYGQVTSFSLSPGSANLGDLSFIIVDDDDTGCNFQFILFNPGPCSDDCSEEVDAGVDVDIDCFNEGATVLAMSMDNPISYTWTDASGMEISNAMEATILNEGWVYVEALFANGCVAVDSLYATDIRNNPSAVINASTLGAIDCNVTEILLSSDMEPNVTYTWMMDQEVFVGDEFTATSAGLVTLTAMDNVTGCSNMDTYLIEDLTEYPLIDIVAPENLGCLNSGITLDASGSDNGSSIMLQWYGPDQLPIPGATDVTLDVSDGGFYYLESFDSDNGCIHIDSVQVINMDPDNTLDITSIAVSDSQFNLNINATVNNYTIEWTPATGLSCSDCPDPLATIDSNATYYASIFYGESCSDMDSINLIYIRKIDFYIPTAFSPNGDGLNETFGIYGDDPDAVVADFYIFDRWGEQVYEANNFTPSSMNAPEWDGKFKNQDLGPGVYVYYILLVDGNGVTRKFKGDITLLR